MSTRKYVRWIFIVVEAVLLAATLALAGLWIARPSGTYDGLALLSGTAFVALEFLRRFAEPEDAQQKLEESIGVLAASIKEQHASEPKSTDQVPTTPKADATPDPRFERILSVIELRNQVIERMKTLAELKGISTNQEPTVIASQLPIAQSFRQALGNFFAYATDFPDESQPMSEWAFGQAKDVLRFLDMLIGNAKAPAP